MPRFELPAVDLDSFGHVINSPARFERVQRVAKPLKIGVGRLWDDIDIHFKGTVHRIGGNGFCGCARVTLLRLLHERARALGVELKFQTEYNPNSASDADLIVAADGINSRIRAQHADAFRPSVDLRPNKFAWMGSTRPFDAFTFFFKETEFGIFIAHCYQYEVGQSTWVMALGLAAEAAGAGGT